jgi:hypothetical protein
MQLLGLWYPHKGRFLSQTVSNGPGFVQTCLNVLNVPQCAKRASIAL